MTTLKGYQWEAWVLVNYEELKALSLSNFLACFNVDFMPSTDVQIELNQMTQKDNQSFHNFAKDVLNKNSLLLGTDSHLKETQVCTRIKAGMDCTLSTYSHVSNKNIHKIVSFKDWLDVLKELDTQLQADHAECHAELKIITQRI